ncbi:malic enzyme-like NAD(P)-binding protein [Staphylococcus aureus]|uniref:malic enzyme-like NAD(P)-binding protein n=1 Tax=Staphylococcus aureus TaxID=1280 RepID=UPI0029BFED61|nr:malic enzyme-like NAD(P)-binding protein [Staphylococcus aureus]WPF99976.1 malic enzyme-like NAD(P)-binding protein [Staphylococcus aureus]
MKGIELLNNPFLNKGTAFTNEERKQLGLEGLLPANVRTLEQQAEQCYEQFKAKQTDFEKRLFLMAIFNRNRTLFYKLTSEHLVEFMPIIYDPVIAQSIEQYNDIEYNGVNYSIGQANNALMYPGLGLGLIASKAKKVNQQILSAASHALGGMVNPDEPGAAVLPPVEKIHQCSRAIAKAVAQSVIDQGLNAETIDDIDKAIEAEIWYPEYKSYI